MELVPQSYFSSAKKPLSTQFLTLFLLFIFFHPSFLSNISIQTTQVQCLSEYFQTQHILYTNGHLHL